MKTSAPVGIVDFALITALGSDKRSQRRNALAGSLSGMVSDMALLRGRETFVGRIRDNLPAIPHRLAELDFRANRLLMRVLDDVQVTIEQQKQHYPLHRIGVIMATSTSGVDNLERALPHFDRHGKWPAEYLPHHHRMGSISEFVERYTQVEGPAMTVSTACSSGNKALASAKRWLNTGICDIVICGGVDILCELTLRGFDSLGALSYHHSVPFSKNRQGINIGEAAAVFVLSKETAEVNLLGCGESTDAYHISAPCPQGSGAVAAMRQALDDANISAQEIDYINLHGTGTAQNDHMEALAIHQVFADYASEVPCSSSKPQIGHTLGVSGLAELGLCLSVIDSNRYLPHVFDDCYDSNLPLLNLVKVEQAHLRSPSEKIMLSNSFAFGGSNATVVVGHV